MKEIGKQVGNNFEEIRFYWEEKLKKMEEEKTKIRLGGGEKAIARLHGKGKLTARERINILVDEGSFQEIGIWAGWNLYPEYGEVPAGGVVVGIAEIEGKKSVVVANDATVKAGAWFPITCKKVLRAQEISEENKIPIVYLVDSAGVFLPLQDEVFPDKYHFGRVFYNNARLSAKGIYQIAAVLGPCVAGGAYLPIMSDESHIVDKIGSIFLAGPHLVKAAIGEVIDEESLGGSVVQSDISGIIDYRHPDEKSCFRAIRANVASLSKQKMAPFTKKDSRDPKFDPEELIGIIPPDKTKPYDMYQILARILDGSELVEFKPQYGKTIICGTGWIGGWPVGIVANQRSIVHKKTGLERREKELQIGGVIYSDSADKAARFIEICNQRKIPIIFFQDVTGFMVGSRAEKGGIIKDGAKMVNVVANSTVPKITVVVGNSFGAGNYAMCGRAYSPRFLFAWPSASIAVMGGEQASNTLLEIQLRKRKVSETERENILNTIKKKYEATMDPRYAAARLWIDEIIDPRKTRDILINALETVAHNPDIEEFKTGVLQT